MTGTLRRLLRPLKPLLGPVWRRLDPLVSRDAPRSIPTLAGRATDAVRELARRARRRPQPSIRPLRNHELVELGVEEPYYRPRRVYLSAAAAAARELIDRRQLRTALELGPHLRPLIVGADVMDIVRNDALRAEGRRIIHDATAVPWPFDDKAYDLFVALQVFEHLGDRQPEAFREVRRIARHAILSLPIDWVMADPANCHHGLTHERALAWFAPVVPTRILVGNPGHRKRLLYVFEDLPAPAGLPHAAARRDR
jgi:Methyltransferase domain